MARWLCDVCDRTNSEGQTLCWCCGKERRAETVEDLRTALTAANERAERAEREVSKRDMEHEATLEQWRSAEADLTAARALLREVLPWLDTEFFEEDRELHGRVVAYLEGR